VEEKVFLDHIGSRKSKWIKLVLLNAYDRIQISDSSKTELIENYEFIKKELGNIIYIFNKPPIYWYVYWQTEN